MPVAFRQAHECGERAIDVEPEIFALGDVSEGVEVVDGSGVDGAGVANDCERTIPVCTIPCDRLFELGEDDSMFLIDGYCADRVAAEA